MWTILLGGTQWFLTWCLLAAAHMGMIYSLKLHIGLWRLGDEGTAVACWNSLLTMVSNHCAKIWPRRCRKTPPGTEEGAAPALGPRRSSAVFTFQRNHRGRTWRYVYERKLQSSIPIYGHETQARRRGILRWDSLRNPEGLNWLLGERRLGQCSWRLLSASLRRAPARCLTNPHPDPAKGRCEFWFMGEEAEARGVKKHNQA